MFKSTAPLVKQIASLCVAKNIVISVAESCTGGLLAATLTNIAGASNWFECGLVTYSNDSKIKFLGVNPGALAQHGAVSEQVALEMALSPALQSPTLKTLTIAITGIAGPSGGSATKPVGTVCFACIVNNHKMVETKLFEFSKPSRSKIREAAVFHALNIIYNALQGLN